MNRKKAVDVTPNQIPGQRPIQGKSPPPQVSQPTRDQAARAQRENELNNFLISLVATSEQKAAAQEELAVIARRGGVCKTTEDQEKRRGLYDDLGSIVEARRLAAQGPLSALLNLCEM